jgi:hypothetical protein
MPNYSTLAREISDGTDEHRAGVLRGIVVMLEARDDEDIAGRTNVQDQHVLLVKETKFMTALVSLACNVDDLGDAATHVLFRLARPMVNLLPLFRFPGLLDALITTQHVHFAVCTLSCLAERQDNAQRVAMATNAALVDRLVTNVGLLRNACMALSNLCAVESNRALLYEHPGLIAAVTDATRVPACAYEAVGVLLNMSLAGSLEMPMLRNPLVLDALLRAAGSDVYAVSNRAIRCISNLSLESENRALMRDDVRIMDALTARGFNTHSKSALVRICYIGDLPNPLYLNLSRLCSRPYHHHLYLCKALIREHPTQLSAKDSRGRTPLKLARAAHLPAPIISLLSDCAAASANRISLTHLVGYSRSELALARAQRLALMCSLERAAGKRRKLPAGRDSPGELNAGKALRGYLGGGKEPWSVIGRFAF